MTIKSNRYVLAVKSIAATGDVFERVLGFREVFGDGNWRFMKRDDWMVMLGECPEAKPMREFGIRTPDGNRIMIGQRV